MPVINSLLKKLRQENNLDKLPAEDKEESGSSLEDASIGEAKQRPSVFDNNPSSLDKKKRLPGIGGGY